MAYKLNKQTTGNPVVVDQPMQYKLPPTKKGTPPPTLDSIRQEDTHLLAHDLQKTAVVALVLIALELLLWWKLH